ncbi:MAG TPA: GNAT family N-acetyltransferase [Chiayiivirga sp.]|nr:GNAT family N-acetyltransferase [Chiayiivirga sp.]
MSPEPTPIRLRAAVSDDVPALLALEAMFPGDRLSTRQLRHHLRSTRARLRVLDWKGVPAGYALILLRQGSAIARLYSIAVDPNRRGAGLGAALLDDALAAAQAADRRVLRLEVREDNHAAIGLYRRAGFEVFGRIDSYYEDGCAALRMQRAVVPEGVSRA